MSRQGRILVVDDMANWREELSDTLQRAGFRVDTAATISEVWDQLAETFYHLLILDIRMVDKDESNVAGMNLLKALDQHHLSGAVKVMMLSAVGTKEQMRTAFRDHDVVDFQAKEEFDNLQFREQIRRIFTDEVRINLNLAIEWDVVDGPQQAVLNLKIAGTRLEPGTAMYERVAVELDDLLCRLFYEANKLHIKARMPGYSGSGVLWVQPTYNEGAGQALVVKFGDFRKVETELHNFKKHVKPFVGGGRSSTTIRDELRRTPQLAGIVYSFVGTTSGQLEDFSGFYRRAEIAEIKEMLNHLFLDTCAVWYANQSELQAQDLSGEYQKLFDFTPEILAQTIEKFRPSVQSLDGWRFSALTKERIFKNPILQMSNQHLVRTTYTCTTHGDLNQHNILIDQTGQAWLIDFQHTGPGHILRDLVKLDTVVRFELLLPEEANLDERLTMEEALSCIEHFGQVDQLEAAFASENLPLVKAYATSVHLRQLASQITASNPSDDFSEYHIAAFYTALEATRFNSFLPIQREHALLSVCLLAERLEL